MPVVLCDIRAVEEAGFVTSPSCMHPLGPPPPALSPHSEASLSHAAPPRCCSPLGSPRPPWLLSWDPGMRPRGTPREDTSRGALGGVNHAGQAPVLSVCDLRRRRGRGTHASSARLQPRQPAGPRAAQGSARGQAPQAPSSRAAGGAPGRFAVSHATRRPGLPRRRDRHAGECHSASRLLFRGRLSLTGGDVKLLKT